MTFHVGQLVVCVDARAVRDDIEMPLVKGEIYTVADVVAGVCPVFGAGVGLHLRELESLTTEGWLSDRFRPLNNAKLVARIKSCKTQSIPAEPCLPSHASRFGSAAGDTHVSGGTLPTAWAEAREDSGEKFTNSNSHGERNG